MRRAAAAMVTAVACACAAGPASAFAPPTVWDGANPFGCEVQQAGLGAMVAHPEADPFCIEFDKRRQNITQLGIADFLAHEPARLAAAVPKCRYFQVDHWRASVIQDDGSTKLYEWDGHYFFDKSTGDGGVWVTNFNVNGHTFDPSQIPGLPRDVARYLGPGTGGMRTHNAFPGASLCTTRPGGRTLPIRRG
jgi:hypothetical protein